jgi:hypothetical protein
VCHGRGSPFHPPIADQPWVCPGNMPDQFFLISVRQCSFAVPRRRQPAARQESVSPPPCSHKQCPSNCEYSHSASTPKEGRLVAGQSCFHPGRAGRGRSPLPCPSSHYPHAVAGWYKIRERLRFEQQSAGSAWISPGRCHHFQSRPIDGFSKSNDFLPWHARRKLDSWRALCSRHERLSDAQPFDSGHHRSRTRLVCFSQLASRRRRLSNGLLLHWLTKLGCAGERGHAAVVWA